MLPNKEIIESIRQKFLKNYETQPTLYHENDIKNIRENDWPIERFVLVNSNEEKALQAVIKAMQWRKSFGINDFNDLSFPYELYKMNIMQQYGRDKDGRPLLWLNGRNWLKCDELSTLMKQFYVYHIDLIDRRTSHQGWTYVSDASKTGLSNSDMDFSKFAIGLYQHYYPRTQKYWLNVDVPWIFNAPTKIVIALMNEELKSVMKMVTKEELVDYIDKDVLPVHLDGTNENLIIEIPSGVKRLDQMSDLRFTSKQIEKIYSTFKCLQQN